MNTFNVYKDIEEDNSKKEQEILGKQNLKIQDVRDKTLTES